MDSLKNRNIKRFLSIRYKIWLGFVVAFTPIFLFSFLWLEKLAYDAMLDQISSELLNTLNVAAKGINVDDFVKLYKEEAESNPNCPPSSGSAVNGYYPDKNPLYLAHVKWLDIAAGDSKNTKIYTYVKGPGPGDVIGIGSMGYFYDPQDGFKFCELYNSKGTTRIYDGLTERVDSWAIYTDKYGSWITTYTPIRDARNQIVGAIGADVSADHLNGVRWKIYFTGAVSFFISCLLMFAAAYWIAIILTRPIIVMANATRDFGEGKDNPDLTSIGSRDFFVDEIDYLKSTFQTMIANVAERTLELIDNRQQLRDITRTTIKAHEEERRQISRELHDDAQQSLIILKYDLEAARTNYLDGASRDILDGQLTTAIDKLDTTMNNIRQLAHSLRPPLLDVADINLALKDHCREISEKINLEIEYTGTSIQNLSDEASLSLFRFLQEALMNVIKHAHATRVQVVFTIQEQELFLSVNDNGTGIGHNSKKGGYGQVGMVERFKMLGGKITVRSEAGFGTTVTARVPLDINARVA